MDALHLDLFDFHLPDRAIAQEPARPRDASRLMRVTRDAGDAFAHHSFRDLPELLAPGDLLVINRTQVMPARLQLRRPTGGRVELLLHRPVDGDLLGGQVWEGLGRPGSALQPGKRVITAGGDHLEVLERLGQMVRVRGERPLWEVLQAEGSLPLPPYVARQAQASDNDDYQSIFAREPGAVAAPTASLHFTQRVLEALSARGVQTAEVLLHVGPGTFLPIRPEHAEDVRQHAMHGEYYAVPPETVGAIEATRARGGRVIAVGTTSLRALESFGQTGELQGESHLFIYPGFSFRWVDGLVTNFHLPRSTLLLLVAALAGRERILQAYAEALAHDYRFYSYGDAMLIL